MAKKNKEIASFYLTFELFEGFYIIYGQCGSSKNNTELFTILLFIVSIGHLYWEMHRTVEKAFSEITHYFWRMKKQNNKQT